MTEEIVIEYLSEFKKLRSNKCGCNIISISEDLNISIKEAKNIINNLYLKKIISIREGINHRLIFLNNLNINN
jgi:hypothetical protein